VCQYKKTHTYVKPQIIHKQTPRPQHVGREPTPLSRVPQHHRHALIVRQEHILGQRELQHATSAKREPILEYWEPLLPQRVKVSLFLLENPNCFVWFVFGVWGRVVGVPGCVPGLGRVWGYLICSGSFRVSIQENSHVRQTPNNPQTNAKTSACGAGTYSSVEGATTSSTCTNCKAGTYSGAEGASACNKCQAGTYSGVLGATAATTCQGEFVSFGEPELFCLVCFWGLGSGGGCPRVCAGFGSGVGVFDLFGFVPYVNTRKLTHTSNPK
jgi:hypothetical protein